MTGDQNKFNNLKKRKSGSVAFGNDSPIKILGKGVVNLGNEKLKIENVLLVEDMKHNILSIKKLCDQGYNIILNSLKCEIIEVDLGRLVAIDTRNPNNIYILDIVNTKRTEDTQKRTRDTNTEDELVLSGRK